jgi:hypothetical protein
VVRDKGKCDSCKARNYNARGRCRVQCCSVQERDVHAVRTASSGKDRVEDSLKGVRDARGGFQDREDQRWVVFCIRAGRAVVEAGHENDPAANAFGS